MENISARANTTLNSAARKFMDAHQQLESATGDPSLTRYLLHVVANHPSPVTFDYLCEKLLVSKSQVSRMTRRLHKLDSAGKPGSDLVVVGFDLVNPRLKLVSLSPKGLRIASGALNG